MKRETIQNDKLFKRMKRRKNLSEYSEYLYVTYLTEYCTLIGKTPSELRQEAYKEQLEIRDKLSRSIEDYLQKYLDYMEEKDYLNSTKKLKMTIIRSFYNEYDIELPKPPQFKRDNVIKRGSDVITIDHIRKAVNSTPDFKQKAIITLIASSGMRSRDVRFLTIQDFVDATQEYHDKKDINQVIPELQGRRIIPCWQFYPKKTEKRRYRPEAITFSTPECTEYILTYLKQREDLKNDQFLFTAKGEDPYTVYTRGGLRTIFKRINKRLGYGKLPNGFGFFRAHKLRAFFGTTLNQNRVPYTVYKKMMGHTLNQVDNAYVTINKETCKREYVRCIKDLSTERVEVKKVTSDEIRSIVDENKQLREDMDKIMADYGEVMPVIKAFRDDPRTQKSVKKYMETNEN